MVEVLSIPKENLSHEQWLNERRKGIGGSDVGAVVGVNEYRSQKDVWEDKLGITPHWGGNEATEWGVRLEDPIAEKWVEDQKREVRKDKIIRIHSEYPELLVNLDREIIDNNDGRGPGVLEIKCVSENMYKAWQEEIPLNYYCQFQHELAVTGWKWGEFALLVGGRKFERLALERDDGFIKEMTTECHDWWHKYVIPKKSPPLTAGELTKLTVYYEGESIEVSQEVVQYCEDYIKNNAEIKILDDKKEDLKNQIKVACGEYEVIKHNSITIATFKLGKPRHYTVDSPATRTLLVKKQKALNKRKK